MIERTLIEQCPEVYDSLLRYAAAGQPNAMTYIPDVMMFEVTQVCGHIAMVTMTDDEGLSHDVGVPVDFANHLLEGKRWPVQRLRRVLCAEWN